MLRSIELSKKDIKILENVCEYFQQFDPVHNRDQDMAGTVWFDMVKCIGLSVHDEIINALKDINIKVVLIPNVPVPDDLELSPSKDKWRSELRLLPTDVMHYLMAMYLETIPKNYLDEHGGNFIHNITAIKNHDGEFSSAGNTDFPYHCEVPQDINNPRWFSLSCLRGDPEVHTTVMNDINVLRGLTDNELKAMHSPIMRLKVSPSFEDGGKKYTVPLFRNESKDFIFDSVEMSPIPGDSMSESVYTKIMNNLAQTPDIDVAFEPGNFVVLNNRRTLHSRAVHKSMSSERWLTRMYYR